MPAKPSVTVVIPTYRRPELLRGAMRSVLDQTFADFRLVVSDDDASGEVAALVRELGDPRATYRANTPRLGQALNPLLPMSEASSPFVACLQDDDLWEPTMLATLVPPLVEDPEVVVSFSDHALMDAGGTVQAEATAESSRRWGRAALARGKHQPFFGQALLHQTVPAMMTAVIRREAVRWEIPREIGIVSDLWLGYLLARTGGAAWYEPARLGRYRSHEASATGRAGSAKTRSMLFCLDRFLEDEALEPIREGLRERRNFASVQLGLDHLREEHWRAGRRVLTRSLRTGPTRRGAAGLLLSVAPRPLARAALGTRRPG